MDVSPIDSVQNGPTSLCTNRQLSRLLKTLSINVEFQNLTYSVKNNGYKSETIEILKSIHGVFQAGHLTGILGPSGSGKTTLLNILSGYISSGSSGIIKVNGKLRQMETFRKVSAYIMQEDAIPNFLSVHEIMMLSAKLKLGNKVPLAEKEIIIKEILTVLGLQNCNRTRTENLSGGERKRLSIALELVNNPPIIFLDEPTTGLDTVAAKQCIDTLNILSSQGRTVICTIHQPPSSLCQNFNQMYFIANGQCVYSGSSANIVEHLFTIGIQCPITYTPTEYIIELVQISQDVVFELSSAIQNGKANKEYNIEINQNSSINYGINDEMVDNIDMNFPVSFWVQFYYIYSTLLLQLSRNRTAIILHLFTHIFSGILLGALFFGIGNDASLAISNFKYCFSILIFFVYTYLLTPVLEFPLQMQILQREYFNRWFSLKAYFMAVSLQNLPLLIILGTIFTLITYLMADQPLEPVRIIQYSLICLTLALTTEGLGLAIGAACNITMGLVIAVVTVAPCVILCICGMGYGPNIEYYMKILMSLSYIRYALVSASQALFANREPFECYDEIYCHYKEPKHLLRDVGMLNASYTINLLVLIAFLITFRILAYIILKYRVTGQTRNNVLINYIRKIVNH